MIRIRGKMHKSEQRTREISGAIEPIGLIHTPFKHADGTPVQGIAGKRAEGIVEVLPDLIEGLRDLEGFDRLWLIYLFNHASEAQLVVRPYLDTTERGVFATRSPVRPNHIGISVVRLLHIEQNRLYVADVDMLDGTPLLDIKPYVPHYDYYPVQRCGWLDTVPDKPLVADDRFERPDARTAAESLPSQAI